MGLSRRSFLNLPVAATAASLCLPLGGPLSRPASSPRDQHFIAPFNKRPPQQRHTYLPMQKALPEVEARLRNWSAIAEREAQALKTSQHPAVVRWRQILGEVPPGNTEAAARHVNVKVNQYVPYLSDWTHGHKHDIWYGPIETLTEGGDCEDYSLLKAVTLTAHGWPTQTLHLVAGELVTGEGHMMLGIDFGGGRHGTHKLMDNLSPELHPRPFDAWTPKYQIGAHQQSFVYIQA